MPWPHVVRIREPQILVEPVPRREKMRMMSQVPLAEDGGGVPLRFAQLPERRFVVVNSVAVFGAERADDSQAVRIAPGEESGPRRRTDRLGDVEISEANSFAGHPVEIRRGEAPGPVTTDVSVALVIGEDDDHVGPID